ncbi:MAG: hypothetical protein IJZ93_04730 [Clostridia bacterium]|nr:hypothetical protein [Clostridia bacterium]
MKKFFLLLFIFIILTSCAPSHELLYYQEKSVRAECTLNGEYGIVIEKTDGLKRVVITSPSELAGTSFEILNEECYIKSADGIKMSIERSNISGICALVNIFSLNEENMIKSEPSENSSAVYTFLENGIAYEVTYNKNSLPSFIHITSNDFKYDIEINAIELE